MELRITDTAKKHIRYWNKSGAIKIVKRIERLLESIEKAPFSGIGKPEPLKHQYSGKWSRRITQSDRLVYEVIDGIIYVYSCKGHYN